MWYGKGPGVDRCGDVFKHANAAGTSKHGGVLVLAGDDHAAKSSTLPHQSEHIFKACLIPAPEPVERAGLSRPRPARLRDEPLLRLLGRVQVRHRRGRIRRLGRSSIRTESASKLPDRFRPAAGGGLNIRWPDGILEQEARMLDYKVYAALAYARANGLDRIIWDSPQRAPGHRHHRQVLSAT